MSLHNGSAFYVQCKRNHEKSWNRVKWFGNLIAKMNLIKTTAQSIQLNHQLSTTHQYMFIPKLTPKSCMDLRSFPATKSYCSDDTLIPLLIFTKMIPILSSLGPYLHHLMNVPKPITHGVTWCLISNKSLLQAWSYNHFPSFSQCYLGVVWKAHSSPHGPLGLESLGLLWHTLWNKNFSKVLK